MVTCSISQDADDGDDGDSGGPMQEQVPNVHSRIYMIHAPDLLHANMTSEEVSYG